MNRSIGDPRAPWALIQSAAVPWVVGPIVLLLAGWFVLAALPANISVDQRLLVDHARIVSGTRGHPMGETPSILAGGYEHSCNGFRPSFNSQTVERRILVRQGGIVFDGAAIIRFVGDTELGRYPIRVFFDVSSPESGEFVCAVPLGSHPRGGFGLVVHPAFGARSELLPHLIAYHFPPVNYGELAAAEDCEAVAAARLNMDIESYYNDLCEAADSVSPPAICGVES